MPIRKKSENLSYAPCMLVKPRENSNVVSLKNVMILMKSFNLKEYHSEQENSLYYSLSVITGYLPLIVIKI